MKPRSSRPPAPLWLEERYPHDVRARSREIERLVAADLKNRSHLRFVDMGSGLGANLRYYADFFDCDQEWHCIEKDRALCAMSASRLKCWAAGRGWSCRSTSQGVVLQKTGKTVAAYLWPGSFIPFPASLAGIRWDLAMANAVFDLVSRRQFLRLAQALASRAIPLLATLNYTSMRFVPSSAEDRRIVASYDRTMTLPRNGRTPMGPGCAAAMTKILAELGYRVSGRQSSWVISQDDRRLLHLLLQHINRAVTARSKGTTAAENLREWTGRKKAGIRSGSVKLLVRHLDLYARVPRARVLRP